MTNQDNGILILTGKPALTELALGKKITAAPGLAFAEYVHILKLTAPLDDAELRQTERLLDYGPNQGLITRRGEPFVTVDGLRMSKKRMYFSSDKARRELGYRPRPATEALTDAVEWLVGVGDSGFKKYGFNYNALPTVGTALRLRPIPGHLEVGVGGEGMIEASIPGNVNAHYHTPGISYEDWIRGEVAESYIQEFGPELADYFPDPEARQAIGWKGVGYVGFGGAGPLVWNNLFLSYEQLLPQKGLSETFNGVTLDYWVHDFTDERRSFNLGNEMQLRIVPRKLDAVWAVWVGNQADADNSIVPSDFDRTYASTVLRLQAYTTETVHLLVENSVAQETSKNGNAFREHADSIFLNTNGQPDTRGLEYGDTDTRNTWQGKAGVVLNPLGTGIYTRPSLRALYGVQYSNQNNAFGNSFVESLDQYNDFDAVEQHWHHLLSLEAEVWF